MWGVVKLDQRHGLIQSSNPTRMPPPDFVEALRCDAEVGFSFNEKQTSTSWITKDASPSQWAAAAQFGWGLRYSSAEMKKMSTVWFLFH